MCRNKFMVLQKYPLSKTFNIFNLKIKFRLFFLMVYTIRNNWVKSFESMRLFPSREAAKSHFVSVPTTKKGGGAGGGGGVRREYLE